MSQPDSIQADAERFYSVLHATEERARDDAGILLPTAEQQVERHRVLVAELRQLLARLEGELDHWAATAANLRASLDPERTGNAVALGGHALANVAATVVAESGKPSPLHYRDVQELVRLAGYSINGVDAQATLLSALGRSKLWEPVGARTGLWKLADGEEA